MNWRVATTLFFVAARAAVAEPLAPAPVGVAAPADVPAPAATSSPGVQAAPKKKPKGYREQKENEGTEAQGRFEADTILKSQYQLNGQPLEVDPD